MNPKDIPTREPFSVLFPVDAAVRMRIEHDMRERGFDPAHPLILWQEGNCVLDGHTRLAAAIACDIAEVPAVKKSFDTEYEAMLYAVHCQKDRRNISDADLLRLVQSLDKRTTRSEAARTGGLARHAELSDAQHCAKQESSGRSSAQTAAALGVSPRKVEQVRQVIDHADEETKEAVAAGNLSINAATKRIKVAKKARTTQVACLVGKASIDTAEMSATTCMDHVQQTIRALLQLSDNHPCPATCHSLLNALADLAKTVESAREALQAKVGTK